MQTVQLCGISVPLSPSVKCLGLTLQHTLRWQDHLGSLAPKCYAVIASLRRLRDLGITVEGLLLVYKALLIPLLCYGITIWGGGYRRVLHRGEIIQNDALRAIFGRCRRDSVDDVFDKFELLRLNEICTVQTALLAFKMLKGKIANDISFPITAAAKRTTRRATVFMRPFAVKESTRQALAYRLPAVWGSLPCEIRSITSAKKFAYELKKVIRNGTYLC